MTLYLGVSNSKDSGVALASDARLIYASNEERFSRQKLTNESPYLSLQNLRDYSGIENKDIAEICLGTWKGVDTSRGFERYINFMLSQSSWNDSKLVKIMYNRLRASIASDLRQKNELEDFLRKQGLEEKPIVCYSHHEAHAAGAFLGSGLERALTVTMDGRGDFTSTSISVWETGNSPKLLRLFTDLTSFGYLYSWVTRYLGFTPDRHEGKVTGLSANGNYRETQEIFSKTISFNKVSGEIDADFAGYYAPDPKAVLSSLEHALEKHSRVDIAAGLQRHIEKNVEDLVGFFMDLSGEKNICLSGGLFANVLLNRRLHKITKRRGGRLYVFPHMGDGGIAAGAAMLRSWEAAGNPQAKLLDSLYLGPDYSANDIYPTLTEGSIKVIESGVNYAEHVAHLIASGKIVGHFAGRMEFGPRALGNRSIFYDATKKDASDRLNKRLARSEFMPFAPIILGEYGRMYLEEYDEDDDLLAAYMTGCFKCTETMVKRMPGVVHVDGTCRAQIVSSQSNLLVHSILSCYAKKTSIGGVINTSFNSHEEPIVCSPHDAIKSLEKGVIDALAIYPFIAEP